MDTSRCSVRFLVFSGSLRRDSYNTRLASLAATVLEEKGEVLFSPDAGTWHPSVKPDQQVEKGAVLGTLTDYFGETMTEIRPPMAGKILYVVVSPAMGKGEPVAMVGARAKAERSALESV